MRKLAGLRVTNGLTQADVAKKIGVSQGAVSLWERGDGNPTLDKIPLLAKLYGVTEQEILTACITASPNSIIPQEGATCLCCHTQMAFGNRSERFKGTFSRLVHGYYNRLGISFNFTFHQRSVPPKSLPLTVSCLRFLSMFLRLTGAEQPPRR